MFIFKICPTSFIKPPITRSQVSFKKILQFTFSENCACCSTEYAAFMGNWSTSHPYKMSLSTFNLHGVNSRLLRSGTQLSTFKSTFWTIPCFHHRKFKRRQLDMYSGAGTSVRIRKCAIYNQISEKLLRTLPSSGGPLMINECSLTTWLKGMYRSNCSSASLSRCSPLSSL
jgi:hypothetical protein